MKSDTTIWLCRGCGHHTDPLPLRANPTSSSCPGCAGKWSWIDYNRDGESGKVELILASACVLDLCEVSLLGTMAELSIIRRQNSEKVVA